ncbi:Sll0314/Alr1548 family TPR repeat-containing protein [Nodosilinea sp. E11]|uniref:Sll0314/Alr1548 family TPR repeat-containing protein n=1 Tax=Nodosilinea sp. E11 TaxID=3037479 RepID=UPI0029342044|nr:Sll0314/Alr1548 family TPR repeat-containing protein [Nodosilinea sp. E11]WOD37846.1 Sll0314/Alr1548 family TPR repeat-containing protein [Nodosilinea sp. E11]
MAAQAGDPFRPNNPHSIGDSTEAVFNALFYEGNYTAAQTLVGQAMADEPDEPMNYAIAAALGYLNKDLDKLAQQARLTQQTAAALKATDPLRGHLYTAVGIFMEGAHVLQTQGIARGTPTALRLLQRVFSELEAAERIDRNDPELSLLKGFMDLLLAVNLPFANPDQAIARLQNGRPAYLSHRGVAIGMRDLGRYPEALTEVDKALTAAPNNPDLLYLKAQILFLQQQYEASLPFYRSALTYADQLPTSTARQIAYEACLAEGVVPEACSERSQLNAR